MLIMQMQTSTSVDRTAKKTIFFLLAASMTWTVLPLANCQFGISLHQNATRKLFFIVKSGFINKHFTLKKKITIWQHFGCEFAYIVKRCSREGEEN